MTRPIDETHDPTLRSWVESANQPGAGFPIQNLPFGVFRRRGTRERGRIGVAIGDQVVDLAQGRELGLFDGLSPRPVSATSASSLNALLAAGPEFASALRRRLSHVLRHDATNPEPGILVPLADVELLLPVDVGDYSDFYASIFHATNVGKLFRPDNPLLPNFRHVPIAYHGRTSSIVVSGTQVRRPCGRPSHETRSCRHSHRRTGWTTSWRSGSTWGPATRSAGRSRLMKPKITYSDCRCSTTGRQGTFNSGSTNRSGLSCPRASRPAFLPGS